MKKIIRILSVVCLLLCFSTTVFAAQVYTEETFEYTIADESVTIVGYFGNDAEVTVPSMIAGYPVNTIAAGAFTKPVLTTIYLPDTITTIEPKAIRTGITVVYNANVENPEETPTAPTENPNTPEETPNTPEETPSAPTETPNTPEETPGAPETPNVPEGTPDGIGEAQGDTDMGATAFSGDGSGFVEEEDGELEASEIPAPSPEGAAPGTLAETDPANGAETEAPESPEQDENTTAEAENNHMAAWLIAAVCAAAVIAACVVLRKRAVKK